MNDLQFKRRKYRGFVAYGQSKLPMNTFTFELARRLTGTGVTANRLHRDAVASNFWSADPPPLIGKLILAVVKPFMLNSKQGAEVSLYLATFTGSEVGGGSLAVHGNNDRPAVGMTHVIAGG